MFNYFIIKGLNTYYRELITAFVKCCYFFSSSSLPFEGSLGSAPGTTYSEYFLNLTTATWLPLNNIPPSSVIDTSPLSEYSLCKFALDNIILFLYAVKNHVYAVVKQKRYSDNRRTLARSPRSLSCPLL